MQGTQTCPYDATEKDECWTAALDTEEIFFRCLPIQNEIKEILSSECVDPIDAEPNCDLEMFLLGKCDSICKFQKIVSKVTDTSETTPNPFTEKLHSYVNILKRLMGDVEQAGPMVLVLGGVVALLAGLAWLLLLQYFAGVMIWLTCALVLLFLTLISLYCSAKAELIAPSHFGISSNDLSNVSGLDTELYTVAHDDEIDQFKVLAYLGWVITGVLFLLILAMRQRIRIAVAIFKEASRCIQAMPTLIAWPIIPALGSLIMMIYWMYIAIYLLSSDTITADDVTSTVNTAVTDISAVGGQTVNLNVSSIKLGTEPDSSTVEFLFVYHLFGLLWTNQLIQAISITTMAGSVAQYYWTLPDKSSGKRKFGGFPVASALKRALRFHVGSLIFGAFIIAAVQLARIVLEYVDHNTKELQESNAMIKVVMKVVKCCLWCFEKCLKFLSKNAYIIIAMKGSSFCYAARQAFVLILANVARVATVNTISFFLLLLAKISITAFAGLLAFSTFTSGDYGPHGSKELSSPFAPLIVTLLLAWFVSSSFMAVYDMAIDSILICFCEDTKLNNQGASEYMSPELAKIMGGHTVNSPKQIKVSPK